MLVVCAVIAAATSTYNMIRDARTKRMTPQVLEGEYAPGQKIVSTQQPGQTEAELTQKHIESMKFNLEAYRRAGLDK